MNTNIIFILVILFLIVDRIMVAISEKDAKKETTMADVLVAMKMNAENNSNVSFEETKSVMNTMIDEYLDHMYTMENDKTYLIKNKDFPTEWGGIYMYPSQDVQKDQIKRLKESIRKNSSETFLNRIRIFYSDAYIDEYVSKTIEEKYVQRREVSDTKGREFKKLCLENQEKYKKDAELQEKKMIAEKHHRLNKLLTSFEHSPYLPEAVEEIGVADRIDGTDTNKLLKGRYLLNKKYYDELGVMVQNENDVFTDTDKYKRVDDRLISYLSKEMKWNEVEDNPYVIEEQKHIIVEVSMRYEINPLEAELFGAHPYASNISEDYKGKTYDMTGKRLNNAFYFEDIYESAYSNINEAAVTEELSAILV